jgi:hypothetical protein
LTKLPWYSMARTRLGTLVRSCRRQSRAAPDRHRRGVSQNPRDPQLIRPDGRQAARADVDIGRVRESVAADNVDRRLPALDQRGAVVAPVFAVHAVDPRGSHPVEGQMRSSVSRRAPATKRHGRSVFSDPRTPISIGFSEGLAPSDAHWGFAPNFSHHPVGDDVAGQGHSHGCRSGGTARSDYAAPVPQL